MSVLTGSLAAALLVAGRGPVGTASAGAAPADRTQHGVRQG